MYEGVVFVKIAVCDDDSQVLLRVLSKLAAYREQRQADLSCQGFENAVDLLASMERENYDLLFLDVLMPGLSGIQAAREIRQKNENIKIVFLTSSPEYAVESYSVQATNYLLKPATEERLFPYWISLPICCENRKRRLPSGHRAACSVCPMGKSNISK